MTERDTFLHAIATTPDDDAPRLIFSDWLEQNGDAERAEFIRIQCELASAKLSEKRRHDLRVRERQLLDTHRQPWCQAAGLPIEDVAFERGLIARVRLSRWEDGCVLDPEHSPWLTSITELDLSGLRLGDDGVAAFAETARLPALRKLILSDNGLTDAGAAALVSTSGLPRLDTLYLFANRISAGGRSALGQNCGFLLANLDIGERAEGYCMSPGEVEMARRQQVRTRLLPVVARHFATYARLQSAMLCVAQYWNDEANDAVHGMLIVSELFEPTLQNVEYYPEDSDVDPNVPNTHIPQRHGKGSSSVIDLWDAHVAWDDNGRAIPLWAAFAPEGGTQEFGWPSEVYAPAVMFYRHGGYEFLPMCRPYLDGVQPEDGYVE